MRIFTAALGTETNTFSPLPTGHATFAETLLVPRNGSDSDHAFAGPLTVWRDMAAERGDGISESICAYAQPGGLTVRAVWTALRDALLADARTQPSVDLALLHLHGAMVAEGSDDCEGELLEMLRQVIGPEAIIAVELDLHCHLTPRMMANADLIVLYKEYPHTDIKERAVELFRLGRAAVTGAIRPVMSLVDCRMLGVWRTTDAPVRALVDWMTAAEQQPGVLSLSFGHGFPWADVPEVGAKALAIADGDAGLAQAAADDLADRILDLRTTYSPAMLSIDEAIAAAARAPGLVVMADVSDNAGGGAAGDATFLLEGLMAAGVTDVVAGLFWDPVAVRICEEAGEGAELALRVGGKSGPKSGRPIDVRGRVVAVRHDCKVPFGGGFWPMGTTVWFDAGEGQLVLTATRTQTFHSDAFAQLGIDLPRYRVVVVKSAQHFHAGFAHLTSDILYVATEGTVAPDFATLPLPRAGRPLWPHVADPFDDKIAAPHGRETARQLDSQNIHA
jgi:microcystin degradation protein MlrC